MTVSNAQGEYEQLERERVEEDMRLAGQAMGKRDLEDRGEGEEGPAGKKAKVGHAANGNGNGGEEEEDDMEMEMDEDDDEGMFCDLMGGGDDSVRPAGGRCGEESGTALPLD